MALSKWPSSKKAPKKKKLANARMLTMHVDGDELDRCRAIASKEGISLSEFIRKAMADRLEKKDTESGVWTDYTEDTESIADRLKKLEAENAAYRESIETFILAVQPPTESEDLL